MRFKEGITYVVGNLSFTKIYRVEYPSLEMLRMRSISDFRGFGTQDFHKFYQVSILKPKVQNSKCFNIQNLSLCRLLIIFQFQFKCQLLREAFSNIYKGGSLAMVAYTYNSIPIIPPT